VRTPVRAQEPRRDSARERRHWAAVGARRHRGLLPRNAATTADGRRLSPRRVPLASTGGTSGSPRPLLRWRGLRERRCSSSVLSESHSHRRRAHAGHRRPSSRVALLLFVRGGSRRGSGARARVHVIAEVASSPNKPRNPDSGLSGFLHVPRRANAHRLGALPVDITALNHQLLVLRHGRGSREAVVGGDPQRLCCWWTSWMLPKSAVRKVIAPSSASLMSGWSRVPGRAGAASARMLAIAACRSALRGLVGAAPSQGPRRGLVDRHRRATSSADRKIPLAPHAASAS
jgi:hypothetical protein